MKSVLITGSYGGIGRVLCTEYKKAGYNVIGVDKQYVEDADYNFLHYNIRSIPDDPELFKKFKTEVREIAGDNLSCIVNNAAVQILKKVDNLSWDDWEETFKVNLFAAFFLVQAFLPELRKNTGTVVNIASIHAQLTKAEFAAYSTSKGALISLTRALALDLAPEIRVNAVVPAATETPMLKASFEGNEKGYQLLGEYHPLRRIAKPEEVAKTALFLSSTQSSFISGSAIWVDGGIGGVLSDPVYAR